MSELATRLHQLKRILEISRELTSTVSLASLLRQIVDAAVELIDSESASILLVDKRSGELRFIVAADFADQPPEIPVPIDASIAGVAFTTGKPVIVPDVRNDPRHYPLVAELTGLEMRSLLALPLQFKERRIGVLEVANKREGEFNQEDVETLTVLAAQATVVIENARLVQALQKAHDQLEKRVEERTMELAVANTALQKQIAERRQAEEKQQELIGQLQTALAEVKTLSGLLPICASCKKIRDDAGYWHQVEVYVSKHSGARFSHGLCPDCAQEIFPRYSEETNST